MSQSERITFAGTTGAELAGRLELPPGPPRGYALFAHCFTCSKDVVAATRISRGLAEHGIAVLRFDFTGLGNSDGDFAHTNFSSNVGDLLAAAEYMRSHYQAPAMMIGHSLGGAAVLVAAREVPECKVVATIGAPCDPEHVTHLFTGDLEEIESSGVAEVSLAGRPFQIQKQFVDDLRAQNMRDRVASLGKALLVFHSPVDDTVGIENARQIYDAAKHPKSFVSLDNADHLLRSAADAQYVADVLVAWAGRYIGEPPALELPSQPPGEVAVMETGSGRFQNLVRVGDHGTFLADEPESIGGTNTGPGPYDFLLAGLGACTSMTLRMYAERKKWPLDAVRVQLKHQKTWVRDAEACEGGEKCRIDYIHKVIHMKGDLDTEQRTASNG
ncbi:MAG: bifunctional alpha/beta hydrolase/OsmC family protein, partial [Myxococcota bacterium]